MLTESLETWFLSELELCSSMPIDEKNLLLEKITVIVPSYNRQDFLLRLMLYWANSRARVIIVDGSPQPLGKSIQGALLNYPNIKYIHNTGRMEDRLALAAQLIETPYAVMSGDDEFHLKHGLCSAIKVLEDDSELVGCIGQSVRFGLQDGTMPLQYGDGYPHYNYSIRQEEIGARLVASMSTYNAATCYAVMRKSVWQRSWGNLRIWSSPYTGELQQALTTYIHGKFSTIKEIYWLRSFEVQPVSIRGAFDRHLSFYDWWVSNKYKVERNDFVDVLANEMVQQAAIQPEDARRTIIDAVDVYLDWWKKQTVYPVGILQRLRLLVGKIVRMLLSGEKIDKIKLMLGIPVGVQISYEFNLGSLAELQGIKNNDLFVLNDELLVEMKEIEDFVAYFYQARDEEIGLTEVMK